MSLELDPTGIIVSVIKLLLSVVSVWANELIKLLGCRSNFIDFDESLCESIKNYFINLNQIFN
jgi:hypothetical protein